MQLAGRYNSPPSETHGNRAQPAILTIDAADWPLYLTTLGNTREQSTANAAAQGVTMRLNDNHLFADLTLIKHLMENYNLTFDGKL